ncbi:hypothetical protein N7509_012455 [Penicillium cosmopolitanum]|uniref:LsmAD domain-containing protein n=1 Tax=Penicillium cosmopolitanum TaxID=1131564 RepID=A0A9W9SIQ7_9EURO|nr:uncharacterized protein N7509_012455 [Penicillium cosmopolitanum]KAJ5379336.1 hypothetical protein N7509_012455 [Penicillium cosmopolitanum]
MASTLNSTPAANSSGNPNNPSQNPGRSTLRSSANSKADGRRQSGSPGDAGQRRSNSHKAWSQGTNPITQRSTHASSNGNMAQKQSGSPRPGQKESNTFDNHAHDRLVFLFATFIGLHTTITTKNGDKYTGIFSSSTLEASDSSFLLKMVQRTSQENQPKSNGVSDVTTPYLGAAPEHSMAFDVKDIADISVPNVSPAEVSAKETNGAAKFRTDADISGNLAMRERTLQRWEPAEHEADMSLDSSMGHTAGWDQFAANEKLFGAKTDYDENIYTTSLDRSSPAYRQQAASAAKIAAEIEGTSADNPHMREERGQVAPDTGDQDEEDKYSGVRRENKIFPPLLSGQPNKYTPPGRRQAGAPPAAAQKPATPAASAATPSPSTVQPPVTESAPKDQVSTQSAASAGTEQKSTSAKISSDAPGTSVKQRTVPENVTANVETEVLDHFRQFANSEKIKMQERRRNQASYDRTLKLNELMKFSQNFKLHTPVPKDLVPILAKDRTKQESIINRVSEDKTSPKISSPPVEQKPQAGRGGPTGAVPPAAPADRQNAFPGTAKCRFPQQPMQPGRPSAGMLSHRLADNLQQRKGAGMGPVPTPLPIQDARGPPTGPANEQPRITSPVKSQAPTSSLASKFNVRAMEFKPNPAASTFTPGGPPSAAPAGPASSTNAAAASPRPFSRNRSGSRATTPSAFFGNKKPLPISERPSIDNQFNPIKRMKKESSDSTEKSYAFNGSIPPPYKTLPTWDHPDANQDKTFDQMFKHPGGIQSVSPQGRSASNNPHLPQQHSMPFHPGMAPASGPPNGPHLHQGPHGPASGHMDDQHRMQISASSSQVFPSPRMQQSGMGYPSPMGPHAQMAFGQPVPGFYGAPQPGHLPRYQGGPQFMNSGVAMGGAPMMQQPSNGPYMGVPQGMSPYNPQMPMYSPSPGHAYPQHAPLPTATQRLSQPKPWRAHDDASKLAVRPTSADDVYAVREFIFRPIWVHAAYPTISVPPGRGGYAQQQPHFSSSPHQPHHFPPNQHRTPSNGFNQVPQMAPQMANNAGANAAAGSHSAEPTDEGK